MTAFGRREEHYLIELIACWQPEDDARRDVHADWVRRYESQINPFACLVPLFAMNDGLNFPPLLGSQFVAFHLFSTDR